MVWKNTENLVDGSVPAHRDAPASSSRESASEPRGKVVSGNTVLILTSRICMRTKITRAPCSKRTGEAILRAENFGDLITADHKVLSEGCESRNDHRYAVVVQDLATEWILSYPFKKSPGNRQELTKVLGAHVETKPHWQFPWNWQSLYWQFLRIRQSLWRSFLESLYVNTTQIGNKRDCWRSSAQD